eukprot:gene6471-134_t
MPLGKHIICSRPASSSFRIEGASDPNDPTDRRKRPLVVTNTFFVHLNFPKGMPGVGGQCSMGSVADTVKNTKFARPGFLMNSNTVVRNANVQGQLLGSFSGGSDLCGFGLFELPGCIPTFSAKGASVGGTTGCMAGPHNSPPWEHFNDTYVTGPTPLGATGRAGYGVENVLIENVRCNDANAHKSPVAFWSAMAPDNAPHKNITLRRFASMKGARDGINVHGNVQGFLAEDIHIENGGDDILGVWGAGGLGVQNPVASGLRFRRVFGRYDNNYNGWGDCAQLFGAGTVSFEDYTCCARAKFDPNNNQNGKVALNLDNFNCCSPSYTHASKFTVTNLVWASNTGENWCKNPQTARPPVSTEFQPKG